MKSGTLLCFILPLLGVVESQECALDVNATCNGGDSCEVEVDPLPCVDRLTELVLRYTGDDCSLTTAGGKSECIGNPSAASPVTIEVLDPDVVVTVDIGDELAVSAGGGKLPKKLEFLVKDFAGALLQTVTIDTSCKDETALRLGDQVGSLQVVSMVQRDGVELPTVEVDLQINVSNKGVADLSNCIIDIDQVDQTFDPFDLPVGGQFQTSTLKVAVTKSTAFLVTVNCQLASQAGCTGDGSVIVLLLQL